MIAQRGFNHLNGPKWSKFVNGAIFLFTICNRGRRRCKILGMLMTIFDVVLSSLVGVLDTNILPISRNIGGASLGLDSRSADKELKAVTHEK